MKLCNNCQYLKDESKQHGLASGSVLICRLYVNKTELFMVEDGRIISPDWCELTNEDRAFQALCEARMKRRYYE